LRSQPPSEPEHEETFADLVIPYAVTAIAVGVLFGWEFLAVAGGWGLVLALVLEPSAESQEDKESDD
jgi:hypothetical protein